jgi:alpha-L-arabinofuranosidase
VPLNDERLFTSYYLNYYLGRYVGDEVVEVSGTCPYYEQSNVASDWSWNGQATYDVSIPEAPALVTRSKDGKRLFLVVANGTAKENLPCHVELKGFRAQAAEGKRLSGSPEASALVEKESDVISALPVKLSSGGTTLTFEATAHSVSFISLTAK